MHPVILGMSRVKNEERWIHRCIRSMAFCDHVILFDDHSSDQTVALAARARPDIEIVSSPFESGDLDEVRDKNFLLDLALKHSPDWIVHLDGDEEITPEARQAILTAGEGVDLLDFRIAYMWDDPQQIRVDGVYGHFRAVRAFRPQPGWRFLEKPGAAKGFHCGQYPKRAGLTWRNVNSMILHWGYFDAELRARKQAFYRLHDPNNAAEDNYRHLTQGDPGGESADAVLKHGGPLRLERI